ncbi:hypothetical protein MMC25_007379 [Agyrium rufum]|nr:hypothetical protein [Agyrium rufum]
MLRLLASVVSVLLFSTFSAAQQATNCGPNQNCPDSLPCCSQYGQCGVGAYCLGGCDPSYSFKLESCVPAPICKSEDYKLDSLDDIAPNTQYLGDATKANWVSSGQPLAYQDQVLLTMANGTVGTLLASTRYVWYGKISTTMKSSRGRGVVSAFIVLSDVKDEIDFEFIGVDLDDVQSNFYFQGQPNYTNEKNLTVDDTFGKYHTYTVDWQPDSLTWEIDGTPYRTLNRNDTWNSTDNSYHYPQSPARIQLSLWPAGLESNGEGTIAWAGGLIDWNSPDIQNVGYYYAMVNEVSVECYDPPKGSSVQGKNSYTYNNAIGTNNTVVVGNDNTILKSLLGTGTNMSADYPSAASSSGAPAATSGVATIPGLTGAGPGTNGQRGSQSSSSSTAGSVATAGPASPSSSTYHGFSQGGGTSQASLQKGERVMQGSLLVVLVAFVFLLTM